MIRIITPLKLELYKEHLLALSEDDKYCRFTGNIRDDSIINYVDKLKTHYFTNDHTMVAAYEHEDKYVGFCHTTAVPSIALGDIGVSVEKEYRGMSFSKQLLLHGCQFLKDHKIERLHFQCCGNNKAMMHIAQSFDFNIIDQNGNVVTMEGMM